MDEDALVAISSVTVCKSGGKVCVSEKDKSRIPKPTRYESDFIHYHI